MLIRNTSKKRRSGKQRTRHKPKQRRRNKQRTCNKRGGQRGGGFLDFIPSPAIDFTNNIITGFQNLKNQLYGLPLVSSRAAYVQPYAQI